jgi:hypothetical protein
VLDGELGELIEAVSSHYQAEALKNPSTDRDSDSDGSGASA